MIKIIAVSAIMIFVPLVCVFKGTDLDVQRRIYLLFHFYLDNPCSDIILITKCKRGTCSTAPKSGPVNLWISWHVLDQDVQKL